MSRFMGCSWSWVRVICAADSVTTYGWCWCLIESKWYYGQLLNSPTYRRIAQYPEVASANDEHKRFDHCLLESLNEITITICLLHWSARQRKPIGNNQVVREWCFQR